MMPQRIQRKRTRGWRMPENTVYVGRPSRWGNPYYPGATVAQLGGGMAIGHTMADCVALYRADWERHIAAEPAALTRLRTALRGKNLACWCPLGAPCHADYLLELVNAPDADAAMGAA